MVRRPLGLALLLVLVVAAVTALAAPASGQDGTCPDPGAPYAYPYCDEPPPDESTPPPDSGRTPPTQGGEPTVLRNCGTPSGPAPKPGSNPRGRSPHSRNPLKGNTFFVDPTEQAWRDMRSYESSGQKAKAKLIARLAKQPRFKWFGKFTQPNMQQKVREYLNCVQVLQPGSVPLMAVLRIQGKECNPHYTAGGAAEDSATKRWYDDFVDAIGSARVVIAFEPDSIGTINCLAKSRRSARRKVIRYGVNAVSKLPNATVYLEGTASDWKSPRYTARLLKYIGISKVRGFMLNVTHYDWTINNIRYGRKVSKLTGGKPFVVSTSYNGRGPVHFKSHGRGINVFCNPRFRGLGPKPTTKTGFRKVDAFMWINRPGLSGAGGCNGAPPTGTWWPARSLMFTRYATQWVRPPKGTHFGFKRHISLCALGAPIGGRYRTSAPESRCKR